MNPVQNNRLGEHLFPFYEPTPRFIKHESPIPDQDTVEQFLQRGGKITVVPMGVITDVPHPLAKNTRRKMEAMR